MTTHFLRDKKNNTIVDIEVSKYDLHCIVDVQHYTLFLDQITNKRHRRAWVLDMSLMQEIRGEYHETVGQKYTIAEFVSRRCQELSEKWELYYVVD